MNSLLADIKQCKLCEPHLVHGVNPVMTAEAQSKILVIGQAPGSIVHNTGIPWNDKSGDRLREWMGVTREEFYNTENFALIPMGFCYPGKGKTGDLPPRKECAPKWHHLLLEKMPHVQLTLLIGNYAQKYYLGKQYKQTLTATVRHFEDFLPEYLPLPHPSPRNNIWLKKNTWFSDKLLPIFFQLIQNILKN